MDSGHKSLGGHIMSQVSSSGSSGFCCGPNYPKTQGLTTTAYLLMILEVSHLSWDGLSLFYVLLTGLKYALVVSWWPNGLTHIQT